jgi:hypothetical protein
MNAERRQGEVNYSEEAEDDRDTVTEWKQI